MHPPDIHISEHFKFYNHGTWIYHHHTAFIFSLYGIHHRLCFRRIFKKPGFKNNYKDRRNSFDPVFYRHECLLNAFQLESPRIWKQVEQL